MSRSKYTKEFKVEAVRLMRESGQRISAVAASLGVSAKSLREWAQQLDADAGQGVPGVLTSVEKQELAQLRRENRELRRERDFLQQAAAYFAKAKA